MSSSRFCCVPSCNNFESSSSDCWFYEFPDDEALFETWMKQCGLQSASTGVRDYSQMICSAHFDGYSFRSDGELHDDAIPTLNLPLVVIETDEPAVKINPLHLFVALFIDEAGKIVNFSLVQYGTVEKWQMDESFEYGVAEIFTNSENSVDKKQGLLGTFFGCSKCKTMKEFGVVVMQKREIIPAEVPEVEDIDTEESQVVQVDESSSIVEEIPTEELEERLVEYSSTTNSSLESVKRKPPPLTIPQRTQYKKPRMTPVESTPVLAECKDETILGIKFFNKRSCNKCGYTPEDEELLQNHVETCRLSMLEPCKNGYLSKLNFKGGQRIRSSYICSKCTLSILHRDLEAHADFHVKFAPFACKCSKCFATVDELAEHALICGQHLFTCKMCHKEFVKKRDLLQHKGDVHGVDMQGQPVKRL